MGDRLEGVPGGPDYALERDLSDGREAGFCFGVASGRGPMTALCAAYGISRKTGYKWLGRYREEGPGGLSVPGAAASRPVDGAWGCGGDCGVAPGASVLGSPEASRGSDARASGARMACGEHDGGVAARRRSCAGRRLRRRLPSPARPFREAAGPNDVWCIGAGSARATGNGAIHCHRRVEPLPSRSDRAAAHGAGRSGSRGGVPALRCAAGAAFG